MHPSDGLGHTISALLEEKQDSSQPHPIRTQYRGLLPAGCRRDGITFATPYSTRYTLPGAVPVIAQLSTGTVYEQNAIAYPKDKQLSTSEERFIELSRQKSFNASFTSTIIYRSVGFPSLCLSRS